MLVQLGDYRNMTNNLVYVPYLGLYYVNNNT